MKMFAALLFSLLAPLVAEAQTRPKPDRLVTISVAADAGQGMSQQTIEITKDKPVRNLTLADLEIRVWIATRLIGSQTDTIRSDACPQLRTIALSFAALPPVPIRPMASYAAEDLPIGPTMKDGYSTALTFDTLASDFGVVTVQLSGASPYEQWGHQAVSELQHCWPT